MGLENRDYYREEPWSRDADFWKTGPQYRKPRSIVTTLIIINAAIFVIDAFSGTGMEFSDPEGKVTSMGRLNLFLSLKSSLPEHPWNFWTLLTHGFAHTSITGDRSFMHVAMNMLVLFFLGRPVEMKYGPKIFLRIWLLAILVSGMGWLIYQIAAGGNAIAVGASGAVSAIVALFVFSYPNEKIHVMGIWPVPAWLVGAFVVGGDLLTAMNPDSHVAWQAHLIGFAFGAACFQFGWTFPWLRLEALPGLFAGLFNRKPKLKVHQPPDTNAEDLSGQADRILQKIAENGEESLTAKERKILNRYSASIRKNRS